MAAEKVDCPVCGKSFPVQTINVHVDECLKLDEDDEESSLMKRKHRDEDVCGSGGDDDLVGDADDADVVDGGGVGSKSWGSLIPYSKKSKLDGSPKLNKKQAANTNNNTNTSPSSVLKKRKSKTSALFTEDALDHKDSKGSNPGKDCSEGTRMVGSTSNEMTSLSVTTNTQNTNISSKQPCESSLITFNIPLAESLRPKTMENFVGQTKSIGEKSFIRKILFNYSLPPSMIFWGPPGSGKDCLLPHVENGTFILLGATTENPSFQVNSALLSRCHVVVLEKLSVEEVSTILRNAVESLKLKCFSDASEIDKLAADKEG
ncbi:ATPase WRNIP1 [Octopus bimaculoides]|uniref:UBZ4-type domain-containing protein n=1 Tax=Octopus bimaculoides TaxID=37653 RepID=A0A0L8G170_OCTBM|nr:ATPase WRNIP1 [Octopus bimaculoides]